MVYCERSAAEDNHAPPLVDRMSYAEPDSSCRRGEGRLDTDCGEELLRWKKSSALFRGNCVADMMRGVPGRSLRICKCGREQLRCENAMRYFAREPCYAFDERSFWPVFLGKVNLCRCGRELPWWENAARYSAKILL
jgi:hypothetical protein